VAGIFSTFLSWLDKAIPSFPDKRIGSNTQFSIRDAVIGAFSMFHTQCSSFLEHQRWLDKHHGNNNVLSIYGAKRIPSDNHIRRLLDPVHPSHLFPVYRDAINWLVDNKKDYMRSIRGINDTYLVALDGTEFHSSTTICCEKCSTKQLRDGSIQYSHSVITPAIVSPNNPFVIPLPQEFITPQDGHDKQDCENAAAKRWIKSFGNILERGKITILGDDLYSRQSICEAVVNEECHFIFVCKDSSHKYMYEWITDGTPNRDSFSITEKIWTGKRHEVHTWRYMNDVPLKDGADALRVNWAELTITDDKGKIVKHFAYCTDLTITHENVGKIIESGRCRWKIENENNNVLKHNGYHLEHNFGHGKENLSNFLLSLNILSFLCHTLLHLDDKRYIAIRERLVTRMRFFNDIAALTTYTVFENWEKLLQFMLKGLKLIDPGD
jgi:hypothetical protein